MRANPIGTRVAARQREHGRANGVIPLRRDDKDAQMRPSLRAQNERKQCQRLAYISLGASCNEYGGECRGARREPCAFSAPPYYGAVRARPITSGWALGLLSFGTSLVPIVNGEQGYDPAPLWHAVRALLEGGTVYTEKGAGDLLYPPSAVLILLPLGTVSLPWVGRLFFVVDLATILAATAILLNVFGLRWRGLWPKGSRSPIRLQPPFNSPSSR
jgi:hypothetical protein